MKRCLLSLAAAACLFLASCSFQSGSELLDSSLLAAPVPEELTQSELWQQAVHSGSLISYETGVAVAYGLFNAQQRGTLIVDPGDKVYEGMVVGYSPAGEDITVNVCKTKHLSNTRASGSDDALRLVPVSKFSLEESLEFLKPDELLEVTPSSIRIRKRILNHDLRMKATKGGKNIG